MLGLLVFLLMVIFMLGILCMVFWIFFIVLKVDSLFWFLDGIKEMVRWVFCGEVLGFGGLLGFVVFLFI